MSTIQPIVGIIMGSDSDLNIMQAAAEVLKTFNIPFELTVVSAHRTPDVTVIPKCKKGYVKAISKNQGKKWHRLRGKFHLLTQAEEAIYQRECD